MKEIFFGRKKLQLVLIALILIFLPLLLIGQRQKSEVRKKAAVETLTLSFIPSSGSYNLGSSQRVGLYINNQTSSPKYINVADFDFSYDKEKLAVSNLSCSTDLPLALIAHIDQERGVFSLTCGRSGGTGFFQLEPNASLNVGFFEVNFTGLGSSAVNFSRIVVSGKLTSEGSVIGIEAFGGDASYQVVQANCLQRAKEGDYNCSGAVTVEDFDAWKADFLKASSSLSFFEYWRRASF